MTRFSGVMGVNLKKLNKIILFLNARLLNFRIQCFQGICMQKWLAHCMLRAHQ